mmetsp:Transcript_170513/g.541687  ORF Transcript_170513/g.541687 Transcript_170513/m.541687 type:complete len:216 (+) Transcript_170513:556-1203(+)
MPIAARLYGRDSAEGDSVQSGKRLAADRRHTLRGEQRRDALPGRKRAGDAENSVEVEPNGTRGRRLPRARVLGPLHDDRQRTGNESEHADGHGFRAAASRPPSLHRLRDGRGELRTERLHHRPQSALARPRLRCRQVAQRAGRCHAVLRPREGPLRRQAPRFRSRREAAASRQCGAHRRRGRRRGCRCGGRVRHGLMAAGVRAHRILQLTGPYPF